MRLIGIPGQTKNWLIFLMFLCFTETGADNLVTHNTLPATTLLKHKADLSKIFGAIIALPIRGVEEFGTIYFELTRMRENPAPEKVREALTRLLAFINEHKNQVSDGLTTEISGIAQKYLLQLDGEPEEKTRAPRDPLDTGSLPSTGPVGTQFSSTSACGCAGGSGGGGASTNAFVNNGNSFGADATIGLNDNFKLSVLTNNLPRIVISNTGNTTYTTHYKATAYPSADAVVGGTGSITVVFDTEFDPNNDYASSIYTAPVAGSYMVATQVCVQFGNPGSKTIKLYKGTPVGAPIAGCTGRLFAPVYTCSGSPAACEIHTIPLVTMVELAASDQIRVVYSGSALDTIVADGTEFGVHLMSVTQP